jgi:tetratricopeptide (TPR) repeat protein
MKNRPGVWYLVLSTAALALISSVAGAQQVAADQVSARSQLAELTLPDLSILEEVVADQIRNNHSALVSLLQRADVSDQQLADGFGLLGQTLHAYELYASAETCYRNATLLDPSKHDWIYLLADVTRALGRLEEAVELFQHSLELKPKDPVCLAQLGDIHLQLNQLALSQDLFASALELDASLAGAKAGLGKVALAQRDFESAVEHLEAAVEAVPEANRLHYSLAMAYRGLGDSERGREHLKLSGSVGLRIADPLVDGLRDHVRGEVASILRGRLAFAAGSYDDAAIAFADAVRASPESARALVNLGSAIGMIGDRQGAIERFQQALEIEPDNVTAHYNLGELLALEWRNVEAIHHLSQTTKLDPEDVRAHLLLASVLRRVGRDSDAMLSFATAGKLDPSAEHAFIGQASILTDNGQYRQALQVLEQAHQRMPTRGQLARALAHMLAACPDQELRNGERALDLAWRVVNASSTLGPVNTLILALAETGQCQEAVVWQVKVISFVQESGTASDQLPKMYADLERYRNGPPCRPPFTPQPVTEQ